MESVLVYWIHIEEHSDILTQGYVGVTSNLKRRFKSHKNGDINPHLAAAFRKYGSRMQIQEIVRVEKFTSEEAYKIALSIEKMLRPSMNIGWNIAKGGGDLPGPITAEGRLRANEHLRKMAKNKTAEHDENQRKAAREALLNRTQEQRDLVNAAVAKASKDWAHMSPEAIENNKRATKSRAEQVWRNSVTGEVAKFASWRSRKGYKEVKQYLVLQ